MRVGSPHWSRRKILFACSPFIISGKGEIGKDGETSMVRAVRIFEHSTTVLPRPENRLSETQIQGSYDLCSLNTVLGVEGIGLWPIVFNWILG